MKRTKHFERPYSDRFSRLGTSWRRPRGIDNPIRRRYRGMKMEDKRARINCQLDLKNYLKNLADN